MKLQLVLWDWNGTLLDDVTLCVDALNRLLARYGYDRQYDLDGYRKIFGFPIRDYYLRAGFDFDRHSFDALAQSYMQDYVPASAACPLMPFPGICSRMPSAVPAVQTGWTPCFSPACTCRAPPPRTPPHRNTRRPAHSPPNMHGYGRNISCCQQQAVSLRQQTHIPWHHRQHAGPGASFSCAEARRHYIHSSVHTSSSSNLR